MRDRYVKDRLRSFRWDTDGNAGVEFALILPVLALLCFGAIELGRALHDYHVVNATVRDAARYLSRAPGAFCAAAGPGVGSYVNVVGAPYTAADYLERTRALAMTGKPDTGSPAPNLLGYWSYPAQKASVDISIDCIDNSGSGFDGIYSDTNFNGFVPHVVLTASVPFTFLFGQLVTSDATITFNIAHNVVVTGNPNPDPGTGS